MPQEEMPNNSTSENSEPISDPKTDSEQPKDEMSDGWQKTLENISEVVKVFVQTKYKQDNTGQILFFLVVISILGVVLWLALADKLPPELTGTLLASIIGYAIGKYGQIRNGSSGE